MSEVDQSLVEKIRKVVVRGGQPKARVFGYRVKAVAVGACADGHAVVDGANFCPECGGATVTVAGQLARKSVAGGKIDRTKTVRSIHGMVRACSCGCGRRVQTTSRCVIVTTKSGEYRARPVSEQCAAAVIAVRDELTAQAKQLGVAAGEGLKDAIRVLEVYSAKYALDLVTKLNGGVVKSATKPVAAKVVPTAKSAATPVAEALTDEEQRIVDESVAEAMKASPAEQPKTSGRRVDEKTAAANKVQADRDREIAMKVDFKWLVERSPAPVSRDGCCQTHRFCGPVVVSVIRDGKIIEFCDRAADAALQVGYVADERDFFTSRVDVEAALARLEKRIEADRLAAEERRERERVKSAPKASQAEINSALSKLGGKKAEEPKPVEKPRANLLALTWKLEAGQQITEEELAGLTPGERQVLAMKRAVVEAKAAEVAEPETGTPIEVVVAPPVAPRQVRVRPSASGGGKSGKGGKGKGKGNGDESKSKPASGGDMFSGSGKGLENVTMGPAAVNEARKAMGLTAIRA